MKGRGILVLEDDAILSMWITDLLVDVGATVLGPAPNSRIARRWLAAEPDAAVIDLQLSGDPVWPFVEELAAANIALVFICGEQGQVPPEFEAVPRVTRMTLTEHLVPTLRKCLLTAPPVGKRSHPGRPMWV